MALRPLVLKVIAAVYLINLRRLSRMDAFVEISLFDGDVNSKTQQTRVVQDCGVNAEWNQIFTFTIDEARADLLVLKFYLKDQHTILGNLDIGWVEVPVNKLLEKSGEAEGKEEEMSCQVKLPRGGKQGILKISYYFGKPMTTDANPPQESQNPPPGDKRHRRLARWLKGAEILVDVAGTVAELSLEFANA